MQPQELKIVHLDPGTQPYFDQNGNQWVNVLFEGFQNEPIKWVVKNVSQYQIGQTVYGHIEQKTSQAGKPYNRFYRDQKPDYGQAAQAGAVAGAKYQPRDDNTQESIARSVALKAAVDYRNGTDRNSASDVLRDAETFLAWLQGSTHKLPPKIENNASGAMQQQMPPGPGDTPNQPVRQWNSVGQHRQEEPLPDEPMGWNLGGEDWGIDQNELN